MNILMAWIPSSERGREVGRAIREAGFDLPNREILGRYLSNVPFAGEFAGDLLRAISCIIAPDPAQKISFSSSTVAQEIGDDFEWEWEEARKDGLSSREDQTIMAPGELRDLRNRQKRGEAI